MHRLAFPVLALLLAFSAPSVALADRKELYTVLNVESSNHHFKDPVHGDSSSNAWGAGLGLASYYGLTNTLHFGGALRVSRAKNVAFDGVTLISGAGTSNTGRLYADTLSFQLGALALYRLDTGHALAPALSFESGVVRRTYSNIGLTPDGASYSLRQANNDETLLYVRAALTLEYRFWERFVASAGVAGQLEPGGLMPWQISIPVNVGLIW